MKKIFLTTLIAGSMLAMVSCNGNSSNSQNSTAEAVDSNKKELQAKDSTELKADYQYAVTAANGGMLEVQLGKLAQKKAVSPKVVEFAGMMVTDHTTANNELKKIAGSKFITLPAILDNKTQKDYDDFTKMERKKFDKAYTDYMIKDHKEDIDEFKKETQDGKDTELKAFANKQLPILQHHLQMAEDANKGLK